MNDNFVLYRLPMVHRVFVFIGAIAFGSFTYFAASAGQYNAALGLGFFAFLNILGMVYSFYRVGITSDEIVSFQYFRKRSLLWNEVARIEPKGGGFILSNHDSDIKIYLNPQVSRFLGLVEFIKQKRPDLWKVQDIRSFHAGAAGMILISAFGALAMFFAGTRFFVGRDDPLYLLLLFLMGAGFIALAFAKPVEYLFEGDKFVLHYLLWDRALRVNDIESVISKRGIIGSPEGILSEQSFYPITIKLRHGGKFAIAALKEGTPALENALQQWMKQYKG
jgi:hypothetical protein